VAGAAGTSDDLYVRAFDGQEFSNNGTYSYFHVNTTSGVMPDPSGNGIAHDFHILA
jgi:hypothetical protein